MSRPRDPAGVAASFQTWSWSFCGNSRKREKVGEAIFGVEVELKCCRPEVASSASTTNKIVEV